MIDRRLLDIMTCPKCKGEIKEKGMFILCNKCELAFPVLGDGVTNMILEEAWPLKKAKKAKFEHKLEL